MDKDPNNPELVDSQHKRYLWGIERPYEIKKLDLKNDKLVAILPPRYTMNIPFKQSKKEKKVSLVQEKHCFNEKFIVEWDLFSLQLRIYNLYNLNREMPKKTEKFHELLYVDFVKTTTPENIRKIFLNEDQIIVFGAQAIHIITYFAISTIYMAPIDMYIERYMYLLFEDSVIIYGESLIKTIPINIVAPHRIWVSEGIIYIYATNIIFRIYPDFTTQKVYVGPSIYDLVFKKDLIFLMIKRIGFITMSKSELRVIKYYRYKTYHFIGLSDDFLITGLGNNISTIETQNFNFVGYFNLVEPISSICSYEKTILYSFKGERYIYKKNGYNLPQKEDLMHKSVYGSIYPEIVNRILDAMKLENETREVSSEEKVIVHTSLKTDNRKISTENFKGNNRLGYDSFLSLNGIEDYNETESSDDKLEVFFPECIENLEIDDYFRRVAAVDSSTGKYIHKPTKKKKRYMMEEQMYDSVLSTTGITRFGKFSSSHGKNCITSNIGEYFHIKDRKNNDGMDVYLDITKKTRKFFLKNHYDWFEKNYNTEKMEPYDLKSNLFRFLYNKENMSTRNINITRKEIEEIKEEVKKIKKRKNGF